MIEIGEFLYLISQSGLYFNIQLHPSEKIYTFIYIYTKNLLSSCLRHRNTRSVDEKNPAKLYS